MLTKKDILTDRLHNAINKIARKHAKIIPVTPKSKSQSATWKENQASETVKSSTPVKKVVLVKKEKKHLPFCESKFFYLYYIALKRWNLTSWAKPKYHPLTDQLLTIIEENPLWCYRQAFGFSKGPGTNPTTGGQTLADLYTEVASELLLADLSELDLNFTDNDIPIL